MINTKKQSVLVTGGSGYLSGWMMVDLLKRGHDVRATLRRPEAEDAVRAAVGSQHVSTDRLTFKIADLLGDAGWDDALDGCDAVMHVASPMGQGQGRHVDLVTPAREGTLRVLRAAGRSGVKQVIVTSSAVAAQRRNLAAEPVPADDETVWTDITLKETSRYARSKVIAERSAWDFVHAEAKNFTLTTILPGMILGPVMRDSVSGSVELIGRMLSGRMPAIPRVGFSIVDVRDLVNLHILALESKNAADQRFLAVSDFMWLSDMAACLKDTFGPEASKVSTRMLPDFLLRMAAPFREEARFMAPMIGKEGSLSSRKAKEWLDWHPRPASEAVIDCARSLIERRLT